MTPSDRTRRHLLTALASLPFAAGPCARALAQPALQAGKLVPAAKPAPALDLPALDGTRWSLAALKGKVVVVNFWATWCVPCVAEMPAMDRMQKTLAEAGVVVLAVNFGESTARMEGFQQKTPVSFPLLADPNRDASRAWQVRVLPASFVVAPDGRLRYTAVGEIEWMRPDILDTLRKLAAPAGPTLRKT